MRKLFQAILFLMSVVCLSAQVESGYIVTWGQYVQVPWVTNISKIQAGYYHSLALDTNGKIIGWGYNGSGSCYAPGDVVFIDIASGLGYSVGLKADGSLCAWGSSYNGGTNVPAGNDYTAISSSDCFNLALKSDSTIVSWGYNPYWQPSPTANDYVAISTGVIHSLALKADGSIDAWGYNENGACNVPQGVLFQKISASSAVYTYIDEWGEVYQDFSAFSLGITTAGALMAWGDNVSGQCNVPAGNDYIKISCSSYDTYPSGLGHCLALRADGSIVAWGDNYYGQCNVPAGNNFIDISAGKNYSLGLKSDGTVIGWGNNSYGQSRLNTEGDLIDISAGASMWLALKSNGSIASWVNQNTGQNNFPSGVTYTAISCAECFNFDWYNNWHYYHSLALKSDGSLYSCGQPSYLNSFPSGNDYIAIASGGDFNIALKNDGSLVAWGSNTQGQCNVPAGNDFIAIAASKYCEEYTGEKSYGLALRNNGTIAAWGDVFGTVPTGNYYTAISAGDRFGIALKSDGSLDAWGDNFFGQCNVPSGNDYVAISAGHDYGLALCSNGRVVAWGGNPGIVNNVPQRNDIMAIAAGRDIAAILIGNPVLGNDDPQVIEQVSVISSYPNPVCSNESVYFKTTLKVNEQGSLDIYNLKGQKVKSLPVDGRHPEIKWDGKNSRGQSCAPGIYFYQLRTNLRRQTGKLLILR